MSLSFKVYKPEDLRDIVAAIVNFSKSNIFTFYGDLGSGKTTMISYILLYLGVRGVINSPSFSIVNEYRNRDMETFYHFDFYRVENLAEAIDIGVEEYIDSGNYCFIEWPQIIGDIIPDNKTTIRIQNNKKYRLISVEN